MNDAAADSRSKKDFVQNGQKIIESEPERRVNMSPVSSQPTFDLMKQLHADLLSRIRANVDKDLQLLVSSSEAESAALEYTTQAGRAIPQISNGPPQGALREEIPRKRYTGSCERSGAVPHAP